MKGVSFSRTDLLLQCSYPFADDVLWEPVDNEAADWGKAWHEWMATRELGEKKPTLQAIAKKWSVDPKELDASVSQGLKLLREWLKTNEHGINFSAKGARTFVEHPVAINLNNFGTRVCAPVSEDDHVYRDRRSGEMCGTIDRADVTDAAILVLDHKTGFDVGRPLESGQLRMGAITLWLMARPRPKVIVAFLHAPRDGIPTIYSDVYEPTGEYEPSESFLGDVRRQIDRIGDGSLRPGEHCKKLMCPARFNCPTRDIDLLNEAKRLLPVVNNNMALRVESNSVSNDVGTLELTSAKAVEVARERLGRIHMLTETYDRLRARLRELTREELEKIKFGVRPDGNLVELKTIVKEQLSKSSIERALGKLKGGREIERLRKLGCVETREEVQIRKVTG